MSHQDKMRSFSHKTKTKKSRKRNQVITEYTYTKINKISITDM